MSRHIQYLAPLGIFISPGCNDLPIAHRHRSFSSAYSRCTRRYTLAQLHHHLACGSPDACMAMKHTFIFIVILFVSSTYLRILIFFANFIILLLIVRSDIFFPSFTCPGLFHHLLRKVSFRYNGDAKIVLLFLFLDITAAHHCYIR